MTQVGTAALGRFVNDVGQTADVDVGTLVGNGHAFNAHGDGDVLSNGEGRFLQNRSSIYGPIGL